MASSPPGPPVVHSHVNGIVRAFDLSRRTGVIVCDYGDLLVHSDHVLKRPPVLASGQMVTFDICDGPQGLHAVDVLLTPSQDQSEVSTLVRSNFHAPPAAPSSTATPADAVRPQVAPTAAAGAGPTAIAASLPGEGFDTARFEADVPDEFICSICFGVLNEPVQTACDHLFCRQCIEDWLVNGQTCPQDRKPLTRGDVREVPRYFKSLLDGLRLHCDFATRGCPIVVTIDQLKSHLTSCPYREAIPQWTEEESQFSMRNNPTAPSFPAPEQLEFRRPTSPRRPVRKPIKRNPHEPKRTEGNSTEHHPLSTRTTAPSFPAPEQLEFRRPTSARRPEREPINPHEPKRTEGSPTEHHPLSTRTTAPSFPGPNQPGFRNTPAPRPSEERPADHLHEPRRIEDSHTDHHPQTLGPAAISPSSHQATNHLYPDLSSQTRTSDANQPATRTANNRDRRAVLQGEKFRTGDRIAHQEHSGNSSVHQQSKSEKRRRKRSGHCALS